MERTRSLTPWTTLETPALTPVSSRRSATFLPALPGKDGMGEGQIKLAYTLRTKSREGTARENKKKETRERRKEGMECLFIGLEDPRT